jgi:hypothetical protein
VTGLTSKKGKTNQKRQEWQKRKKKPKKPPKKRVQKKDLTRGLLSIYAIFV